MIKTIKYGKNTKKKLYCHDGFISLKYNFLIYNQYLQYQLHLFDRNQCSSKLIPKSVKCTMASLT